MKNLMIIVPNLQGGGQERIAALTSVILENTYNIYFVVFGDEDSKYDISDKATFINLNIPNNSKVMKKIINVIRRVIAVRGLRKKYNIDYCISFGRTANIVNSLFKGAGKTITAIRNSSYAETGKRNIINDIVYKKSDMVLCVSEGQRQKIVEIYPEIKNKAYVIYNPCDFERIRRAMVQSPPFAIKENTVVCCGRLEGMKCYKNLFNAIEMARKTISDISLIVIGEGAQKEELTRYINEKEMKDYIAMVDFTDNPFAIISRCSMFAFPSSREGFPNVVVEALACGVPVLSTDCEYGPREMLSNMYEYGGLKNFSIEEYGILTPPFQEGVDRQPEEERIFAAGIIKMLLDSELRERFKHRAEEQCKKFSKEAYRDRIVSLLSKEIC